VRSRTTGSKGVSKRTGSLQGTLQLAAPLRHGKAHLAHKGQQARTGERRIGADDHIHQRVDPRVALDEPPQ